MHARLFFRLGGQKNLQYYCRLKDFGWYFYLYFNKCDLSMYLLFLYDKSHKYSKYEYNQQYKRFYLESLHKFFFFGQKKVSKSSKGETINYSSNYNILILNLISNFKTKQHHHPTIKKISILSFIHAQQMRTIKRHIFLIYYHYLIFKTLKCN